MEGLSFRGLPALMENAWDPDPGFREYGDFLYRYALLHLRDPALAEDAVQDTLLAAIEAHGRFQKQSAERTWLVGILKHKILDHFRKETREVSRFGVVESEMEESDFDSQGRWREPPAGEWCDPIEILNRKRFWEGLSSCLSLLPIKMRRVFVLREIDGFSNEEICEAMTITAPHCRVLLYRARLRLRRCLETKGVQHP